MVNKHAPSEELPVHCRVALKDIEPGDTMGPIVFAFNPTKTLDFFIIDDKKVFGPEMMMMGPITLPSGPMRQVAGPSSLEEIKKFNEANEPFIKINEQINL